MLCSVVFSPPTVIKKIYYVLMLSVGYIFSVGALSGSEIATNLMIYKFSKFWPKIQN